LLESIDSRWHHPALDFWHLAIADDLIPCEKWRVLASIKKMSAMANRILFVLWIVSSHCSAFATGQIPDRLVFRGDTFLLFSYPLEFLPEKSRQVRTLLPFTNTACWRGYVGYWQLSGQKLYLTGIVSCSSEKKDTVSLSTLFGDQYQEEKVAANWFSGELVCAHGQLIRHFDDQSIYQAETVFQCNQDV
jgi:hypothetical protein